MRESSGVSLSLEHTGARLFSRAGQSLCPHPNSVGKRLGCDPCVSTRPGPVAWRQPGHAVPRDLEDSVVSLTCDAGGSRRPAGRWQWWPRRRPALPGV